jgi:hypothetical protein
MLGDVGRTWLWIHFVVNTPTIVGTVDAAIAAAVTVLLLQLANAPAAMVVITGGAVFGLIWLGLYLLQLRIIRRLLDQDPRFPSPADDTAP